MSQEQSKKSNLLVFGIAGVLVVAVVLIWAVTRKNNAHTISDAGGQHTVYTEVQHDNQNQGNTATDSTTGSDEQTTPMTGQERREMQSDAAPGITAGATLKEIGDAARTWAPELQQWYGQDAPDFTLTDIQGKEHRLSDYKGRNVMIVFWATWCPPCKREIPHLALLEKRADPEYLKILAVTNEDAQLVREFVTAQNIDYTVLISDGKMPELYQRVPAGGIPAAAFIDPQGKVKFITVGLLGLDEIKAILAAEK